MLSSTVFKDMEPVVVPAALDVRVWRYSGSVISKTALLSRMWVEDHLPSYTLFEFSNVNADLRSYLSKQSYVHSGSVSLLIDDIDGRECLCGWSAYSGAAKDRVKVFEVLEPVDWILHKGLYLSQVDLASAYPLWRPSAGVCHQASRYTWYGFLSLFCAPSLLRLGPGVCRKALESKSKYDVFDKLFRVAMDRFPTYHYFRP